MDQQTREQAFMNALATFTIPVNKTITVPTFRVKNTAEGGDYADLSVTIHNEVLP